MIPIRKKKTPSYLIQEVKKNHGVMKPSQIYESLPSDVKTHLFMDLLEERNSSALGKGK